MGNTEFIYSIGEIINNLEIQEQILIRTEYESGVHNIKGYIVKCVKCGYTYKTRQNNLKSNKKCPVCQNRKVVKGINDIATTHPLLVKYFINKEETYECSHGSDKYVKLKCPDCGTEKTTKVGTLTKYGFSYPEKFIMSLLEQSNISFICQLNNKEFDWCGKYIYDFYLPSENTIIETHGGQHYKETGFNTLGGRTLQEEQENDKIKKDLALANGIKYYIQLDCRESSLDWIRNSCLENKCLCTLLNMDNINWVLCGEQANRNLSKKICDYYKENKEKSTLDISKAFHISRTTVIKYLKIGAMLEWCDYNPKKEALKSFNENKKDNSKKIICDNTTYSSITDFCKENKLNVPTVSRWFSKNRIPKEYIDRGLKILIEGERV